MRVPENVRAWMVHKGSVAVEGISLTIADFDGETISIAILPLTYWRTNLHTLSDRRSREHRGRCAGEAGAYAKMLADKKAGA